MFTIILAIFKKKVYNFDKERDFSKIDSAKYHSIEYGVNYFNKDKVKNEIVPLWVADMDFEPCPEIIKDLKKQANKKFLGYPSFEKKGVKDAIVDWFRDEYQYEIKD